MRFSILILLFLPFFCLAQEQQSLRTVEHKGKALKVVEMLVEPNVVYTNLDPDFSFKNAAVEFLSNKGIDKSYIFLGDKEKFLISLEHIDSLRQVSYNMASKGLNSYFSFFSGKYQGLVRFRLSNSTKK